jgi:hypothetical protein
MLHPAPSACPVPSPGQRVDLGSTARMVDRAGRHKTQSPDQDIHLANPGDASHQGGKDGSTCLQAMANRTARYLTWDAPSVDVRRRPLRPVVIVTHLVTRSLACSIFRCYGWIRRPAM